MNGYKTIGLLALQRIGEALRAQYGIETTLPYELSDLIAQLKRITRKDDYLDNAAELLRLAHHAGSDEKRAWLFKLAEVD